MLGRRRRLSPHAALRRLPAARLDARRAARLVGEPPAGLTTQCDNLDPFASDVPITIYNEAGDFIRCQNVPPADWTGGYNCPGGTYPYSGAKYICIDPNAKTAWQTATDTWNEWTGGNDVDEAGENLPPDQSYGGGQPEIPDGGAGGGSENPTWTWGTPCGVEIDPGIFQGYYDADGICVACGAGEGYSVADQNCVSVSTKVDAKKPAPTKSGGGGGSSGGGVVQPKAPSAASKPPAKASALEKLWKSPWTKAAVGVAVLVGGRAAWKRWGKGRRR